MKKTLVVIVLCITFVITYFLELNFFSWFTIAGIKPNLFIILILFIGLYAGTKMGTAFGLIFGFAIDFLGSTLIRGISNYIRINWIFTGDISKRICQRTVKLL